MDLGLTGKVALVTGASRGIGLAIAQALAAEGARVAMVARNREPLEAAASPLGALPISADLTELSGCEKAAAETTAHLGPIEVLVNNLGGRAGSSWADTGVEELNAAIATNLHPAVRLTKAVLPGMRERGWGRIVVVSSVFGREAGGAPAYNVAKAAELSFVTSLAREVAADGVTVNAVAPGSVLFEGGSWWRRQQENPDAIADFVRRELPLGRFGTTREVASVVAFLCSEPAGYVSGAAWAVDGAQSRSNI
ncbi:MAG TPA: SDR family oxidoreductase [Candidatus Dormibacteraeota bacterium]